MRVPRTPWRLLPLLLPLRVMGEEGSAPATGSVALEPLGGDALLQMVGALLVVLALLLGLMWALRRLGRLQSPAGGSLRVLGGLSMGARERVVLIQVGEKQLLLGVAPGRVQTLHVLDEPLKVSPSTGEFAGRLQEALSRRIKGEAAR